jgi:Lar family restriction alleviation protein
MKPNEELKPCPFCGGDGISYVSVGPGILMSVQVECAECEVGFRFCDYEPDIEPTREELIEKWNRRAA